MIISPCFVIPNYNHHEVFERVVKELSEFNLPIIIVNDASNQTTTELLQSLANDNSLITLIERKENGGKGAAVKDGMKLAYAKGLTHGFQIDADGQHNLADIKRFLSLSNDSPDSVICGYPVYDESVPLGRLIPRYITHFWVWIETLSFHIKDSMCGFRVYPLQQLISLLNRDKLGERMDFDIEVLVRLFWQGNQLEFLPTRVIYPEQGVSHFNLFKDNWLISKMHTRLFFAMLLRIPRLINMKKRMRQQFPKEKVLSSDKSLHWGVEQEKGSSNGLRFLVMTYHLFGRKLFLLLLHPIIGYFTLTSKKHRQASTRYLSRVYKSVGDNKKINWKQNYQHFYQFGISAIDKISSWVGDIKRTDVIVHNENIFGQLVDSGKGAIFIGSHLGNLELCRALGEKGKRFKLNAIVYNKNALKFQQVLSESNPGVELNLIHVENFGADTAILLDEKVSQGEIIIIVGDRTSVTSVGRSQSVDFLGDSAPFAEGPFLLSGILNCPVYLLFCIKQQGIYNIYLEHFADSLKFPRKNRQQLLTNSIQRYANRLAFYCQKAPMQWFNFFDYWQHDNSKNIERKL